VIDKDGNLVNLRHVQMCTRRYEGNLFSQGMNELCMSHRCDMPMLGIEQ